MLLVEVDDHLGVALGREPVARADQGLAQLAVVVDLAVEDDDDRPVLVGDRLVAGREVDDAQPLDAETRAVADEVSARVGAAVLDHGAHALEQFEVDRSVDRDLARDPAHCSESLCASVSRVKALVTGGAGFIGSNLLDALLRRGDDVVLLDNFASGRRERIDEFAGRVRVVEGDLRSYERVHAATAGVEVVFHQGALPSVPRSVQDPLTTNAVNVDGTLNVLLAARDENVRRVVFASSSSIYGDADGLPRVETQAPAPLAPYAVSKLAAESYCRAFWKVYSLETVSLRYFNVFGPRQDPTSQYAAVVPRFVKKLLEGEQPIVYGDGEQKRDFTFVGDVVEANLLAAEADGIAGESFNIATGSSRTVNELASLLAAVLDRNIEPVHVDPRAGDVRDSAADIRKAEKSLGYRPSAVFEDALRITAEFFESRL